MRVLRRGTLKSYLYSTSRMLSALQGPLGEYVDEKCAAVRIERPMIQSALPRIAMYVESRAKADPNLDWELTVLIDNFPVEFGPVGNVVTTANLIGEVVDMVTGRDLDEGRVEEIVSHSDNVIGLLAEFSDPSEPLNSKIDDALKVPVDKNLRLAPFVEAGDRLSLDPSRSSEDPAVGIAEAKDLLSSLSSQTMRGMMISARPYLIDHLCRNVEGVDPKAVSSAVDGFIDEFHLR